MTKQDEIKTELMEKGYKLIKTQLVSMNGNRQYKTYILESPTGERTTVNFRGTVNSKNSLTS